MEDEYFKIGFRFNGTEIIGFEVTARSSTMKRWAYFGIMTLVIVVLMINVITPEVFALFE